MTSALLLISVLDMLVHVITGRVTPQQLHDCIVAHLEAHKIAYGTLLWTPKFHYALHLADQMFRHGLLIACFMLERKHKIFKRWCTQSVSKKNWERTVLEEVTFHHMESLHEPLHKPTLMDARVAAATMVQAVQQAGICSELWAGEMLTSLKVRVHSRTLTSGDIVLFVAGDDDAPCLGELYFTVSIDGIYWSCVSKWEIIERSDHYMKAIVHEAPAMIKLNCLLTSLISSAPALVGEVATVLMQCNYKC